MYAICAPTHAYIKYIHYYREKPIYMDISSQCAGHFFLHFSGYKQRRNPPARVWYSKFLMHSAGAALPWSDYDCVGLCQEPWWLRSLHPLIRPTAITGATHRNSCAVQAAILQQTISHVACQRQSQS